ncbi:MAG: AzlC family ABC transporter permease [Geobacteraceae bacterium]|nr:AzlC family ABC transporter permease [Geobacteraceae bacterium]
MIYGVLAVSAGLSTLAAQSMSFILFAGSAQFILARLIADSASLMVMVMTVFVVNLRHALYSASVAPYVARLPLRWKFLLSYLLTDEAYAVTIRRFAVSGVTPLGHWYFLGAGLTLWSCWQASTAVGVFLGSQIPPSWGLDFTLALTFIAIVVPLIADRAMLVCAVVAALAALLFAFLPMKLGLLAAAAAGIVAGFWSDR